MREGLITVGSPQGFEETLRGLLDALKRRRVPVFARIDHAANAEKAGLGMPRSTVLVFGAPRVGTPLMQAEPSLGLDLPLRALVFEAADGAVAIAYNRPAWIVARHGLDVEAFPQVAAMSRLLGAIVEEARGENAPARTPA